MQPSSGLPEFNIGALLVQYAGVSFAASLVLYVFFGIVLMALARKTRTPNAGLAWLPIGNLFLMCQIGRRPGWWVVLLLIPIVNLVVSLMLWIAIADARGKPGWLGALVVVPVLGLLVVLFLIAGPETDPSAGTATASPGPSVCSHCGTPFAPGEAFCGACGQRLPAATPIPASPTRRMSDGKVALSAVVMLLVLGVIFAGVGYFSFGRSVAYAAPARKPPAMPKRMAGTLTEFPVDDNADTGSQPTSVVSNDLLDHGNGAPKVTVPEKWLPKGMTASNIAQNASAITSAAYTPKNGGKGRTYVHVLTKRSPASNLGKTIATSIAQSSGGRPVPTRVVSPTGTTYQGWTVKGSQTEVIVLSNTTAPTVIVIYAPTPDDRTTARRLAGDVGNGAGLVDYSGIQGTIEVLPVTPPSDLTLVSIQTQTPQDLGISSSDLQPSAGSSPEAGQQIEWLWRLIPRPSPRASMWTPPTGTTTSWSATMATRGQP